VNDKKNKEVFGKKKELIGGEKGTGPQQAGQGGRGERGKEKRK